MTDFDDIVEPLQADAPDATNLEVARQAGLTATYYLELRSRRIPAQAAKELTLEWMALCAAGTEDEEEDE